ncbi:MAG: AbgT family transporter [Planctomycetota bacterium]
MSDPDPSRTEVSEIDETAAPGGGASHGGTTGGFLGWIEKVGNRLPDPATLFLIGTIGIMGLSAIAVALDWSVTHELPKVTPGSDEVVWEVQYVTETVALEDGTTEEREVPKVSRPTSLLTADGIYWLLKSLVDNFMGFPPLGIVLVGMIGIGLAERVGLVAVLLKYLMLLVPRALLTPAMVFLGIMSSMGIDAGYVVLPPLAAMLYRAVGRSPMAGIAAVFAGVAAGFNANLFITGLDPMLAGFTQEGANVLDPDYLVAATCNWWFAIASTFVMTLAGWFTTSLFVERRFKRAAPEDGGPVPISKEELEAQEITGAEKNALGWAVGALFLVLGIVVASVLVEGWALNGTDGPFEKWVGRIVPILFFCFTVPSLVYGVRIKAIRNDKDAAKMMVEAIAAMAPIIVLAFFAAQFIECFKYSGLDRMAALAGGQALGKAELDTGILIVAFIAVTIGFNLFVGSMSAKYAMFAPIFVPMFMLVGISPELTQAAYRIGDSVSNIITPLNAYLIIVLVFMRQVMPKAGMGTLIATMLPYTIVFAIVWTALILGWVEMGWPLGPGETGPLTYDPLK